MSKQIIHVLNDYKDLDGKILIKRHSISMRKVILKQKQGLEKDKKRTCLIALHQMPIKITYYRMQLGQGHLDEALNIATYLDDNDITKLALI